ncbi:hypothetical protein E4U40_003825 [Claviceps sp. LM458 group G5]|nr:hypothetical protein E4U40_003825 [Claviceps sp. LM458 group G5]
MFYAMKFFFSEAPDDVEAVRNHVFGKIDGTESKRHQPPDPPPDSAERKFRPAKRESSIQTPVKLISRSCDIGPRNRRLNGSHHRESARRAALPGEILTKSAHSFVQQNGWWMLVRRERVNSPALRAIHISSATSIAEE